MKSIFLVSLLITFASCNKTNDAIEYKGEVIRGITGCSTPKGFPYIIYYTTANNTIDSLITAYLPSAFNLPGTKILFKINSKIPDDEIMDCNAFITTPVQKSIYDVKSDK